jgi:hypothetical protein
VLTALSFAALGLSHRFQSTAELHALPALFSADDIYNGVLPVSKDANTVIAAGLYKKRWEKPSRLRR